MAIHDSKIKSGAVTDNASCFIAVGELQASVDALCRHMAEAEKGIDETNEELKTRNLNGCEHSRKIEEKMKQINNFRRMTIYQVICVLVLIVGGAITFGESRASQRHLHEQISILQTDVSENNALLLAVREKQVEVRNTLKLPR